MTGLTTQYLNLKITRRIKMTKLEELDKALDEARGNRMACEVNVLRCEDKARRANVEERIAHREFDDADDAFLDAESAHAKEYKRVNPPSKEELEARAARISEVNEHHEARYEKALEESRSYHRCSPLMP
jgi:hypothetical protein